jgi:hypothetical protein
LGKCGQRGERVGHCDKHLCTYLGQARILFVTSPKKSKPWLQRRNYSLGLVAPISKPNLLDWLTDWVLQLTYKPLSSE